MLSDVFRFRRRLQKIKQAGKQENKPAQAQKLTQLNTEIKRSIATALSRKQNLPLITYPDILPIAQKSDLIKKTILENQVPFFWGKPARVRIISLRKIAWVLVLVVVGK